MEEKPFSHSVFEGTSSWGKRIGHWKNLCIQTGNITFEGFYNDLGEPTGVHRFNREDGSLERYVCNLPNGTTTCSYEDGKQTLCQRNAQKEMVYFSLTSKDGVLLKEKFYLGGKKTGTSTKKQKT